MALTEKLKIDLVEAQAAIRKLGKELDKALAPRTLTVLNPALNPASFLAGGVNPSQAVAAIQAQGAARVSAESASAAAIAGRRIAEEGATAASAKATQQGVRRAEQLASTQKRSELLNNTWVKLAATAAALVGTRAVVNFFRDSAEAASDTVEALNAVEKVFDDSAVTIERFVETSSDIGISANAARDIAVQFGSLAQAFGFSQQRAAEFSNELTTIAADLGSIFNVDPEDASRRIFGLFRGEPEPARAIGLSITANQIANEAIESQLVRADGSIVKTRAQLDELTRAQAAYNLIIEQTRNTTNDFADTLERSLPNQLRVAGAEFEDLKARVGDQFQEPLLEGIKGIRTEVLPALERALDGIDLGGILGDATPALVELIQTIATALPAVIEVAAQLGGVFATLIEGASLLTNALGPTATGILAVGVSAQRAAAAFDSSLAPAVVFAADAFGRITADGASVQDQLFGIGEAALAGALGFSALAKEGASGIRGLGTARLGAIGLGVGVAVGAITLAVDGYNDRQREALERQEAFTAALEAANPEVRTLEESLKLLSNQYQTLGDSLPDGEELAASVGAIALRSTVAELSEETQKVVSNFEEAGGQIENFAGAIESGTDIFEDIFQRNLGEGLPENVTFAIGKLREFADESNDPKIQQAVDTFINYGEAVDFDANALNRLADAIDESADAIDDNAKAQETAAKIGLEFQAATSTSAAAALLLGQVYSTMPGIISPFVKATEVAADAQQALLDSTEAFSDADFGSLNVDNLGLERVPQISADFAELAGEFEGTAAAGNELLGTLRGPLRDAVEGILRDGVVGDDDKQFLQILVDEEGLRQDLDEAEVSFDDFWDVVEQTANARALELGEQFANELEGTIKNIQDQLELDIKINDEDSISNIKEFTDGAEKVLEDFNRRRAAADALRGLGPDILGIDALATRIQNGELDELVEQALQVGEDAALAEEFVGAAGAVAENAAIQQAAVAEAAEVAKLTFAQTLLEGENTDPINEWLAGAEVDPQIFLDFGNDVVGLMSESLDSEDARAQREADGIAIAGAFTDGIIGGIRDDQAAVVEQVSAMGIAMDAALRGVLGIQSPSKKGIEIGAFFDEGVAEGLLAGRTPEAIERLLESFKGFEEGVTVDLSGVFTATVDDPETLEDETVNTYTNVINNIRDKVNEATEAANQQLFVAGQREDAIERLKQFGGFDELEGAVNSGAVDELLRDIIFAPNAAAFGQIERELVAAGGGFALGDAIDEDGLKKDGERLGTDFSFNWLAGMDEGFGNGRLGDVLASEAQKSIRRLNDEYEFGSPSKVTFRMGEFLDEGLALGLLENGYTEEALMTFTLTAPTLLPEEEIVLLAELFGIAGEASSIAFQEQLGGVTGVNAETTTTTNATTNVSTTGATSTGIEDSSASVRVSVDVDDSDLDALSGQTRNVDFAAKVDDTQLDAAEDRDYSAEFIANVDASQLDALEQRNLNLSAVLGVSGVTVNGITFPAGGVVPLDRGGLMDRPALYAVSEVRGHPEMVAGAHHAGRDVYGWMQEAGITPNVEPFFREKFLAEQASQITIPAIQHDPSIVAELRAMKAELEAIKVGTTDTATNTTLVPEMHATLDAGVKVMQRPTRTTNLRRGGAKL